MYDGESDRPDFAELVAPYRRELHLHCYHMLGSVTYADELLQETMIAAWQGYDDFAGRSSLRTWLYRIATNRCLNAIRDGRRRPAEVPLSPFAVPEPTRWDDVNWVQPYPDRWLDDAWRNDPARQTERNDTVSLAFVAALQRIPPRQSAAVILHDVLGFATAEIATMLTTGTGAVKGLLQRGRASLGAAADEPDDGETPSTDARRLADRFAAAFAADDVEAMVGMLTDETWLRMPPAPHEYRGPEAIGAFLLAEREWRGGRSFVLVPTAANRQPAFVCSLDGAPLALLVLAAESAQLRDLALFVDPAVAVLAQGPLDRPC